MKKTILMCTALCAALTFTGCKSSESAYKKAYEKAKASESAAVIETSQPVVETPVVTPIVQTPATETVVTTPVQTPTATTTTKEEVEKVPVRTETISVVDGAALKNFSVVVGSFGLKANAEGLTKTLRSAGYDARIAFNSDRNMYRVVASSFGSKEEAVTSRDQLRSQYPDAWLLYQK